MVYKVTDKKGHIVKVGDKIEDFRQEPHTFLGVERGPLPGKDAKVQTNRGTFYASVFNLTVIPL